MEQNITELKGVGDRLAKLLKKLGIETISDLVHHFPRSYDDYSEVVQIATIKPGMVSLKVRVTSITGRYVRRGLHITEAILSDDSGSIKAVWFNQPYRRKQIKKGVEYYASGHYELSRQRYSLMNPSLELVSDMPTNAARIVPKYPETKGLKSHQIRKLIAQIDLAQLDTLEEWPIEHQLSYSEALTRLHFPQKTSDIEIAKSYFAKRELFVIMLAGAMIRAQNEQMRARSIPFNKAAVKSFVDSLGYDLTDDQRKVAWRCLQDISKTEPMNRLVEGDVGSGKTLVAEIVALNAVKAGSQVAFMVPTSVLATQHHKNLQKTLPEDIQVGLLLGSMKAAEKKAVSEQIKSGEIDIVIGTHALFQQSVEFSQLDLVIIDEQHRFGVAQRNALVGQSNHVPHVLTMTATPIPRTLALTVYGDLDISLIQQMPKGRKPVLTKVVSPNSRRSAYLKIEKELAAGRQAFVVYPIVEESEKLEVKSATEEYKRLQTVFKDFKVGLVHGRMKAEEKDVVMRDFSEHSLDILVSTTVIEVGVDVPNASVMMIEGAERFGLAQLHQLRGRVGRGSDKAYCFLVPSSSQIPKRLKAMETVKSGFALAEYDLELRGPGAIYGTRQSGELDMTYIDFHNPRIIEEVQNAVQELLQKQGQLVKYPRLTAAVQKYQAITRLN